MNDNGVKNTGLDDLHFNNIEIENFSFSLDQAYEGKIFKENWFSLLIYEFSLIQRLYRWLSDT